MSKALEMVSVQATAPGTGAEFAAVSGDSTQIRFADKGALMLARWGCHQTLAGFLRITSPLMHDAVVGIQEFRDPDNINIYWKMPSQALFAQDNLTFFGAGSNGVGEIDQDSILIYYPDLPGIDGTFISPSEMVKRAEDLYVSQVALTLLATGGYSGAAAINADQDQFKANRQYAILGAVAQVNAGNLCSVGIRSPDWGNLRVGIPGISINNENVGLANTETWFVDLSHAHGLPLIPVMSANNKNLILVDGLHNDLGGVTATVSVACVLLGDKK